MGTAVLMIIFPFIAGMILWMVFRNKNTDKAKSILAVSMIVISLIELAAAGYLVLCDVRGTTPELYHLAGVCGLGLHFRYTAFRGVLGVLSAAAWFVTFLFSIDYMKKDANILRYDFFNLLTLSAVFGVFYAADLFTLFFFFEMMSFTSFLWVAHRQTKEAAYAAGTYLGIAIAGGMAILMGLFIVYNMLGTLDFNELSARAFDAVMLGGDLKWFYAAAVCMFVGFGAKAGAFPVHVWLPASYTEAPSPASALLSAILSKTGVFGILVITADIMPMQGKWGLFVLIIGVLTMVLGGIRGVMSNNFKTTIAYSSMSQIGFIIFGIGIQGLLGEMTSLAMLLESVDFMDEIIGIHDMAIYGTRLHIINHSIVKLVLFMAAGVVFANVGSYDLNRVRGFGRKKPFLLVTVLLAAAGVGGIPLLNGYVSKTLLHESIAEYTALLQKVPMEYAANAYGNDVFMLYSPSFFKAVEWLFLFSGGLTIAYMTKLVVVLFVEKNQDVSAQNAYEANKQYLSVSGKAAISLCAALIPIFGCFPKLVSVRIVEYGQVIEGLLDESMNYFSLGNLSGALISIGIGAAVYLLVVRLCMLWRKEEGYRSIFPAWLDMEKYVYRTVFFRAVPFVLGIFSRILDSVVDTIVVILRKTVYHDRALPYELPEGNRVTHRMGYSMEQMRRIRCAILRKEYQPKNYEHKLALKETDLFENFRIIERSLSFGLFMFCVGLGLTMLYLLMVN